MLKLYLDYSIFCDFIEREPKSVLDVDKEFRKTWNALWDFIESGSDLTLINVPENTNDTAIRYLTLLTKNRGKSIVRIERNFKAPFKCKFDLDEHFQSIFFLNEISEERKRKYVSANSIPVAFAENYLSEFSKLALLSYDKGKSVRKIQGNFNSWKDLENYLIHLSDVVIADNYLFSDKSLIESNFIGIVKKLYEVKNDLNITIVTYNDPKHPFDLKKLVEEIKLRLKEFSLKEKFNLILLNKDLKEHDRGIFTNFLRIKSGDSFNFFNSSGEIVTKGTELDFYSLQDKVHFNMTQVALDALKIASKKTNESKKHVTIKNRLLNIT
jgi:hypothetical protein